jgi:hypothetical protein
MSHAQGNCQFRAFAHQLFGSEKYHSIVRHVPVLALRCIHFMIIKKRSVCVSHVHWLRSFVDGICVYTGGRLRQKCVQHLQSERDAFMIFFSSPDEFDSYIKSQSRDRTWGDEITLKACASKGAVSYPVLL